MRKEGGAKVINFIENKLPPKLRGSRLIALKAEDHYVHIYTENGTEMILMKFEDAVQALSSYNGVITHRSWWIALDAIRSIERTSAGFNVTLDKGLIVPVSRRRKAAMKAIRDLNKS